MKISAEDSAPELQFSTPTSFIQAYRSVIAARGKRPDSAIGAVLTIGRLPSSGPVKRVVL
jgi:hypothetical protein